MTQQYGRFRVTRHSGGGGMGVVYAAPDEQRDRHVALKAWRSEAPGLRGLAAGLTRWLPEGTARYSRSRQIRRVAHMGRGSVDEYLEQTAIANPHVTLHYQDPEGNQRVYPRSTRQLPPELSGIRWKKD